MTPDQYSSVKSARGAIEPLWYSIWDILFPSVPHPASVWATDLVIQNANDFFDTNAHTVFEQFMNRHFNDMPALFQEAWLNEDARQPFINMAVEAFRPVANRQNTSDNAATAGDQNTQGPTSQAVGETQGLDNSFPNFTFGQQTFQSAPIAENNWSSWPSGYAVPSQTRDMHLGLPSGIIPLTPPRSQREGGSSRGPGSDNPGHLQERLHVDNAASMNVFTQMYEEPPYAPELYQTGEQFQSNTGPQQGMTLAPNPQLPGESQVAPARLNYLQEQVRNSNVTSNAGRANQDQRYNLFQDDEEDDPYGSVSFNGGFFDS